MSKLIILLLAAFLGINCIEENQLDLQLYIKEIETKTVGKKGTAVVSFEQTDTSIEFKNSKKEIAFNSKISSGTNVYTVGCGLWNTEDSSYEILIFCNIEENIISGNYSILFNEVTPFVYGNYNVTLNVEGVSPKFEKVDRDIVDLYSDPQIISIEDGIDSYELQFNIVSYNQEKIFLNSIMILDCRTENNILKCPFTKSELLAYLQNEHEKNKISYLDVSTYKQKELLLVGKIKVQIKYILKKDIYVGITKLLVNVNEEDVPIAYETNVTDISNFYVYDKGFDLPFINTNKAGTQTEKKGECNFLKYDNNPLYLVCNVYREGQNRLKEITTEVLVNNLNIQYNYKIQPVRKDEIIQSQGIGSYISWYYPKVLDFTKNNGNISVFYSVDNPGYLNGFTYNEDVQDLFCEIKGKEMKKCEVNREHFKGKGSGLYFLKHRNHLGNKTISYEIQPIKVILKSNIISSSLIYSLILFLIMI